MANNKDNSNNDMLQLLHHPPKSYYVSELRRHSHQGSVSKTPIIRLLDEYPLPKQPDGSVYTFAYGTAGFRYDHSLLPAVFIRMGIFAVLRSTFMKEQVGIMVTASHNKEVDNGIKMADPDGGMLASHWEPLAVKLINASSTQDFLRILESLYHECDLSSPFDDDETKSTNIHDGTTMVTTIHLGRDTRSHSEFLANLSIKAAVLMGATVYDHGLVSTPQLHYITMHSNPLRLPTLIPPSGGERGYYETMVGAYVALLQTSTYYHVDSSSKHIRYLYVDSACGVGADKVSNINNYLHYFRQEGRNNILNLPYFVALNKPGDGPLNDHCGAEYVQKNQLFPTLYSSSIDASTILALASLDGDADRIVFTYRRRLDDSRQVRLLDGDKIAVLVSSFIQEEIKALSVCITSASTLRCGVVQTAYANGASTFYLKVGRP